MTHRTSATSRALACETCGRLPHPPRLRLTLAKLAAVLPIEAGAHAFFLHHHLPYLVTVALLAVTATVLVIWVAEPSAMRLLGTWLHARQVSEHRRLHAAPALWRIRTRVPDQPGALERLTGALAAMDVNILTVEVQPGPGDPLDELVVAAPHERGPDELLAAVARGGGLAARVWPTSVMALADSQTRALDQAIRVAVDPEELPAAIATLMRARQVEGPSRPSGGPGGTGGTGDVGAEEVLKVPWRWGGALLFARPGEPFTLGERARAQRLAQLAELVGMARLQLRDRAARVPTPGRPVGPASSTPAPPPPSAPPAVRPGRSGVPRTPSSSSGTASAPDAPPPAARPAAPSATDPGPAGGPD